MQFFRLDNDFYVRLPRLEKWAGSIDHEWTWLPKLAPHISLNIPKPVARGNPTDWYPCPWAIYHWLEGFPCEDNFISDECQFAYDLVYFILELRSVNILGAPRGGQTVDRT